jgi:hypothetical protein
MQQIHNNTNSHHHHQQNRLYQTPSTQLANSEMPVNSNISAKDICFKINSYNMNQSGRSDTQLHYIIHIIQYK